MPRRIITVRSADREDVDSTGQASNPSSFRVNIPYVAREITKITPISASIPNAIPNYENSNEYEVTIPAGGFFTGNRVGLTTGFYSIIELCSAFEDSLNTIGAGGFTVVYDSVTAKVTIARSVDSFQIDWYADSNLGEMLGFTSDIPAATTSITGDSIVNMGNPGAYFHIDMNLSGVRFDISVSKGGLLQTMLRETPDLLAQGICLQAPTDISSIDVRMFNEPSNVVSRTTSNMLSDWEIVICLV